MHVLRFSGFFFKFLFCFERDRASGGGAERQGEIESQADSAEPDMGLELTNREIMT